MAGGYGEGEVAAGAGRDLLKSYERGLYEHCAFHAGDPHWGGMIAEHKPESAHNSSWLGAWNFRVPPR